MKFVKVLKANWEVLRRHHDTENGEDYYYIWGPDGEYCDADGNPYHFKTREEALEEVEYLKAEHKFEKKSYVGYDAKPGNDEEKLAVKLGDKLMQMCSKAWDKYGFNGYSTEEERQKIINVEKEVVQKWADKYSPYFNDEILELIHDHLEDNNYHTTNEAIKLVLGLDQAKQVKSDYSTYNEEDKAIYNETMKLLKECRDLLNWHYEQGKDMNFDDYELDDTQRLYRQADLEVLRNIKTKIETLFEN